MKIQFQKSFHFPGLFKSAGIASAIGYFQKKTSHIPGSLRFWWINSGLGQLHKPIIRYFHKARRYGFISDMDDYEKRKLAIFNQLNFFQLLTGIIVPLMIIFSHENFSILSRVLVFLPTFVSVLVLFFNSQRRYDAALFSYFILYPFVTSLAYINGMNIGIELFFMLYGIMAVFFLQHISHMMFCIGFSMVNYFMLAVVLKKYQFYLETASPLIYKLNHLLAIGFIFYGLYLIKKENTGYQAGILSKNNALKRMNQEIQKQKEEISEKAAQLDIINNFKNKLFSIISHDLKAPVFALRNLIHDIRRYNLPTTQIKKLLPDVEKDLNYTTGLMENLLHWAKSQMNTDAVYSSSIDVQALVDETIQLLHLQAEAKKIRIESRIKKNLTAHADKDMISLVLRNLVSNAIKFTPENGLIVLSANESNFIEISVKDAGTGISAEALKKIRENKYFTTRGTHNESGTGLGLMLCKEFLAKNGGQLYIESQPGKGSVFSFTLPKAC